MLNICMVNAFILWKESMKKKGTPYKKTQTEFRVDVIRQLVGEAFVDTNDSFNNSLTGEFDCLTGRHFIKRILIPPNCKTGKVFRTCKVCSIAEREFDRRRSLPKRKRTGHETRYECSTCNVLLSISSLFFQLSSQRSGKRPGYQVFLTVK